MCATEAAQHCDCVVVGEAEHVWHTLLQDLQRGTLRKIFRSDQMADLTTCPVPVRSVLSRQRYLSDVVQTTKGCPFDCEFCSALHTSAVGISSSGEIRDARRLSPRLSDRLAATLFTANSGSVVTW